jgi:hypothetical protein
MSQGAGGDLRGPVPRSRSVSATGCRCATSASELTDSDDLPRIQPEAQSREFSLGVTDHQPKVTNPEEFIYRVGVRLI